MVLNVVVVVAAAAVIAQQLFFDTKKSEGGGNGVICRAPLCQMDCRQVETSTFKACR